MTYVFGNYVLDTTREELRRNGVLISIEPKAYQTLVYLVANAQRLISKEELLQHVWPGVNVDDTAVRRCIRAVRQALEENNFEEGSIETRHGRGYRFVAAVAVHEVSPHVNTSISEKSESAETTAIPKLDQVKNSLLDTAIQMSRSVPPHGSARVFDDTLTELETEVFWNVTFGIALILQDHPEHQRARALALKFQLNRTHFITTKSVLLEVAATLTQVLGRDAGLELIDSAEEDPNVEILPLSDELYLTALRFVRQRKTSGVSLVDPISEFLMARRGLSEAMPVSSHKKQDQSSQKQPVVQTFLPALKSRALFSALLLGLSLFIGLQSWLVFEIIPSELRWNWKLSIIPTGWIILLVVVYLFARRYIQSFELPTYWLVGGVFVAFLALQMLAMLCLVLLIK